MPLMPSSRPTRCGWRKANVAAWYAPSDGPAAIRKGLPFSRSVNGTTSSTTYFSYCAYRRARREGCRWRVPALGIDLIQTKELQVAVLDVPAERLDQAAVFP